MTKIAVTKDLAACHALRRTVFIEEQGIAEPEEWDDLDGQAVHLLALDTDGHAVGTARLLWDGDAGRIGRVCVLKDARGTGLGAELIRFGMDWFREKEATSVVLGAQCHAAGFYGKLGFVAEGEIYDDAGIPHQEMRSPL